MSEKFRGDNLEPEETEILQTEKEKLWQEFVDKFKKETDALGYGIEPKIFDTVVGLNALGINTNQSCQGELDRGRISPWVDCEAPNKPERFKDEDKISAQVYQEVADELGLTLEEAKMTSTERGWEAWQKYWEKLEQIFKEQEETQEYKQWVQENKKLHQKVLNLLQEFYQEREISTDKKIIAGLRSKIGFGIYNGKRDYMTADKKRTEKQKQKLAERLEKYQEEFQRFAEFLKNKYFSKA